MDDKKSAEKKTYQKPGLIEWGPVEDMTLGASGGGEPVGGTQL